MIFFINIQRNESQKLNSSLLQRHLQLCPIPIMELYKTKLEFTLPEYASKQVTAL